MIVEAALGRGDAAYIGMIGSKTKRASFNSWYKQETGQSQNLNKLICPIGGKAMNGKSLGDKRPEIIAALALAEIIIHIGKVGDVAADQKGATHKAGIKI